MQTLSSFVDAITPYQATIKRMGPQEFYLVDKDGSVLEHFWVIHESEKPVADSLMLTTQVELLLKRLKIYRLVRSVAQQMQYDESHIR